MLVFKDSAQLCRRQKKILRSCQSRPCFPLRIRCKLFNILMCQKHIVVMSATLALWALIVLVHVRLQWHCPLLIQFRSPYRPIIPQFAKSLSFFFYHYFLASRCIYSEHHMFSLHLEILALIKSVVQPPTMDSSYLS